MRLILKSALMISALLSNVALAQTIGNISWEEANIPAPLSGFNIKYRVFGSSFLAEREAFFGISTDTNPNTSFSLGSRRIAFSCSPGRPCQPPSGVQQFFVSGINLPANTRQFLENAQNACSPQGPLYVSAGFAGGLSLSLNTTVMGTTKLPDFLFTSGTLSPSVLPADGTITVNYAIRSICSSPNIPSVGIFLADEAFNNLGFIGSFPAPGPLGGTDGFTLDFSSFLLPAGNYNLVLFADVFESVTESNENNNLGAFAFTLTAPFNDGGEVSLKAPVEFIDPTPALDSKNFIIDDENTSLLDSLFEIHKDESQPYIE